MDRLSPPVRSCSESPAEWCMTNMSNMRISSSRILGISYVEARHYASHTLFTRIRSRGVVSIEVMVPSAGLVHASKITDSSDLIGYTEALNKRRHNAKIDGWPIRNKRAKSAIKR